MAKNPSNNPVFSNNAVFQPQSATTNSPLVADLNAAYHAPAATAEESGRMTVEDTIAKTGLGLFLVLAGAAVGWMFPQLLVPAAILGFVLALVNIFKKVPSPGLVLSYAAAQGVFLGGLSLTFETTYPGIVTQAVIATFAVAATTLALFASGKIRASARATKIFMISIVGYLVYALINMILMLTGVAEGAFGLNSMELGATGIKLGVLIGAFVVLLAAYSLVLDFDMVKTGVENQAPQIYAWRAAFGILLTLIWLYMQILRMLALMRE